jgi:hypothetical protein
VHGAVWAHGEVDTPCQKARIALLPVARGMRLSRPPGSVGTTVERVEGGAQLNLNLN